MEYTSKSPKETQKIAADLLQNLKNGAIICLYGELGAGKTIFVKGLAKELGIDERLIKSPTFTILREYDIKKGKLYHYDFYRNKEVDTILMKQFEENSANEENFIFIEWADHIAEILPSKRIDVFFEHGNSQEERIINIETHDI